MEKLFLVFMVVLRNFVFLKKCFVPIFIIFLDVDILTIINDQVAVGKIIGRTFYRLSCVMPYQLLNLFMVAKFINVLRRINILH